MFDLNQYGTQTAVITDRGERLTYAELSAIAGRMAGAFPKKGLLFCFCENRLGSLVGYVACLEHHIPVVLLDGGKDPSILQKLVTVYQPEYVWASQESVVCVGGRTLFTFASFSLQELKYREDVEKPVINPQLSLCLATSGSTGSPKLVRLTEYNMRSNAESIAEYLGIDEKERPVTTLPSYYSYGVSVINSHLIKGATILLTDGTVAQRDFWRFMTGQGATSIAGVPYTYEMLWRLRFFRMDLPHLKTLTQAGGKLSEQLVREYVDYADRTGKHFIVMYGQTEAAARMGYLAPEDAAGRCSSIGKAIPGGQFTLVDNTGQIITAPDMDGELVYSGPNVSLGYAECRADLARGDDNHGVLHTGDIARRDSDGFYYITGRTKRFVKVWGNRCNLDSLEQLVKTVTTDCACSGVDDKITVFVTRDGLEDVIINLLVKKTGLNNKAFSVHKIASIPKNPSGKIEYAELQKMLFS